MAANITIQLISFSFFFIKRMKANIFKNRLLHINKREKVENGKWKVGSDLELGPTKKYTREKRRVKWVYTVEVICA